MCVPIQSLVDKCVIRLVLIAILLSPAIAGFSQQEQQIGIPLQKYVPLSPNAAELGKYGTYPVGMLTGTPEISYNLFTVQSGELSLPVTLSYHASGIKVNQMATWAGLGWSVNAGGVISRAIYGREDEETHGFMDPNYTPKRAQDLRANTYYNVLGVTATEGDMEPDLFTYNIGNKSGKFIYTREKKFMTIPYAPVKIDFRRRPNYPEDIIFELTDDDGTIYQFEDIEHTFMDNQPPFNVYASSWHLTRIISASRKDTIGFSYLLNPTESSIKSYTCTVGQASNEACLGSNIVSTSSTVNHAELLPLEITFRGGKLVFGPSNFREDGGGYRITHITQYAEAADGSYKFVKKANFAQSYFHSSPFFESSLCYRLRLDRLQFTDSIGNIEKDYRFQYNNIPLPPRNSNSQDYFGFFNNKDNASLIPVTTLKRGELHNSFLAVGGNAGLCSTPMTFGDADRNPDPEYMKAGMLEKVIYPTSGYSIFDFEPHEYLLKNYAVETEKSAAVPRVTGSADFTKRESKTTFTVGRLSDMYGKVIIDFSATPPNPVGGDPQRVVLKNLTTGESRSWIHTGNLTTPLSVNEDFILLQDNDYELTVTVEANTSTYVDARIEWLETVVEDVEKQGGGLRIKSIRNYIKDNNLANEEHYVYGLAGDGKGEPIFDYDYFAKSYLDAMYEVADRDQGGSGGGYGICRDVRTFSRTYQGVADNTSITYMGSPVLYPKVVKYNGSITHNAGKTEYYYEINKPGGFVPHVFMSGGNYGSLDNAWYQGNLRREVVYKIDGSGYLPVSEKSYNYSQLNRNWEYGVALRRYCNGDVECGSNSDFTDGMKYFTFYEYQIMTGVNKLTSEETILYDQGSTGNTIRTTKTYTYDTAVHFYPAEISSADSKGRPIKEQIKYPFDVAGSDPILNRMVSKNMIAVPVENYRYVNNSLVFSEKNTFGSWNGIADLIRPLNKQVSFGNASNPFSIEYRAYDDNGNVREQAKANDINEVYLWGYNDLYPVAKVIGSTYTAVAALVDQNLLKAPASDQALREELSKIRTALAGKALVTTYTYQPLVGMTSETDVTGKTTYYEYDQFGRLKLVRDKDHQIIKTLDYHYKEPEL